jgi:anti-sigma regulatory factor (Ser/Thr protein kinase)
MSPEASVLGSSRRASRGPGRGPGDGPASALDVPGLGTSAWPLRSYLELGALPGAVPCARLHARQVLWEWHLADRADTVELLVSELVTNAIRACADLTAGVAALRLWLSSDHGRVAIQVWDPSPQRPTRRDADPQAEGGRGLLLVDSLSASWGSWQPPGSGGKVVWATVA